MHSEKERRLLVLAAMRDGELTAAALRVLGALVDFDGPKGCFPSVEAISERVCLDERQIRRGVKRLEDRGWLSHKRGGKHTANTYFLAWDRIAEVVDLDQAAADDEREDRRTTASSYDDATDAKADKSGKIGGQSRSDRRTPVSPQPRYNHNITRGAGNNIARQRELRVFGDVASKPPSDAAQRQAASLIDTEISNAYRRYGPALVRQIAQPHRTEAIRREAREPRSGTRYLVALLDDADKARRRAAAC